MTVGQNPLDVHAAQQLGVDVLVALGVDPDKVAGFTVTWSHTALPQVVVTFDPASSSYALLDATARQEATP